MLYLRPLLLLILSPLFTAAQAPKTFLPGEVVEVRTPDPKRGTIVGSRQATDFGYATYQVHLDGEKYCNNHVLDTRYNEAYIFAVRAGQKGEDTPPQPPAKPDRTGTAGAFRPGERVLFTQTSLWAPGTVRSYDPLTRRYRVEEASGDIPCHSVAPLKGPWPVDFFTGTWNVQLDGAMVTTEQDEKRTLTLSGGMRLYPLTIRADGTFSWQTGPRNTLRGRWARRPDAPGIILYKGIDGRDWITYESTEGFSTGADTRDEIRFHHAASGSGYYLARRVGAARSCLLAGRKF